MILQRAGIIPEREYEKEQTTSDVYTRRDTFVSRASRALPLLSISRASSRRGLSTRARPVSRPGCSRLRRPIVDDLRDDTRRFTNVRRC